MTKKLIVQGIFKLVFGLVLVGALVFLPAGTIEYSGGWLFLSLLFVPMLLMGIILAVKSPSLLAKRLDAKEKEAEQGMVVKLSGLMFILGFVAAGLDYRLCISHLPVWVTVTASVVFIAGYTMYGVVMAQNEYLSRTVKVEDGQRVIDSGLYSVVRHPMYSASVVMFLSMPLILGSLIAFAVFCVYPFIIAYRIIGEERFLEENLDGYKEYKSRVRFRLVPFVW